MNGDTGVPPRPDPGDEAAITGSRDSGEMALVMTGGGARAAYQVGVLKAAHDVANALRNEYVVSVRGRVATRSEETVNPKLPTGTVEVHAEPAPRTDVGRHEEPLGVLGHHLALHPGPEAAHLPPDQVAHHLTAAGRVEVRQIDDVARHDAMLDQWTGGRNLWPAWSR